jgi:hypothetical protein
MLLSSTDPIIGRIVKWGWMELAKNFDKTCEIVSVRMGKRLRQRKTHLLMHADADGRDRGMPNLIAELHPGPPLGPYTEDMAERLMDDSVRLGFLIGMTKYALRLFIRDTARGEVYVYRYKNTRVCPEIVWVDVPHNNNTGFLTAWNETRRCTRFCMAHETPIAAGEEGPGSGERAGGPLPPRWKRVPMGPRTDALPPGKIARMSQLMRVRDGPESAAVIVIDDD